MNGNGKGDAVLRENDLPDKDPSILINVSGPPTRALRLRNLCGLMYLLDLQIC
jgi:hypothetical protein